MVHYRHRGGRLIPEYTCRESNLTVTKRVMCQQILGGDLDAAISKLLVEAMTPMTLEVALGVQAEIQSRLQEADRLRQAQVDRARYEVQLAQRRYMQVDPANRLVADALETDWNEKLRILKNAQQEYEHQCQADRSAIGAEHRERILALATDFPKLWANPNTTARERNRPLDAGRCDLDQGQGNHSARALQGGRHTNYQHPASAHRGGEVEDRPRDCGGD